MGNKPLKKKVPGRAFAFVVYLGAENKNYKSRLAIIIRNQLNLVYTMARFLFLLLSYVKGCCSTRPALTESGISSYTCNLV